MPSIDFTRTICPFMSIGQPTPILCNPECAMILKYNLCDNNFVWYCGLCPERSEERKE